VETVLPANTALTRLVYFVFSTGSSHTQTSALNQLTPLSQIALTPKLILEPNTWKRKSLKVVADLILAAHGRNWCSVAVKEGVSPDIRAGKRINCLRVIISGLGVHFVGQIVSCRFHQKWTIESFDVVPALLQVSTISSSMKDGYLISSSFASYYLIWGLNLLYTGVEVDASVYCPSGIGNFVVVVECKVIFVWRWSRAL
jgi:hypothetical protein